MKNLLLILLVAFSVSGELMAQKSRNTESKSSVDAVRADRQVAFAASIGFKSLSGTGGMISYYATPHLAIDVGAGLGFQIFKTGARARYLLSKKRLTPYIGAGINYSPIALNDVQVDNINGNETYVVDINPSTYGQFTLGLEYMGYGGFLFGIDLGYSALLNKDNIINEGVPFDSDTQLATDILYGNSINFSISMGYAF